ncbi:hypothetical protein CA85_18160 [Allorhodopirellula solitaria]|uniref:Uncharacterized protein n=1 Tax=Allorhodopirellula solitaria TaxID=2527987 RepID=A0A5C5YC99_9BACT|nr:hypothetical protein CA85_18160 [Allorhodopirellula solitaria]
MNLRSIRRLSTLLLIIYDGRIPLSERGRRVMFSEN